MGATTSLHATEVNLSGLMEVLGKHLYSPPLVAVRELIQNAHDSCVRRRLESPAASSRRFVCGPIRRRAR